MIKFHAPIPADKAQVDELLARGNYRGCGYNFVNLYVWSRVCSQHIARVDDLLVTRARGRLGCGYMYLAGSEDTAVAIRTLEVDAAEEREPSRLVCFMPRQMTELEEFFPGRSAYTVGRDGYDYSYEMEWLVELEGKKLHAKHNHINRLIENSPTRTYGEITPATPPECPEMGKEWYRRSLQREGGAEERDLGDEEIALRTATKHYEGLGLEDGLIRVYGEAVALTIDDRLSADIYDMYFERVYDELQGAYVMISREFARWMRARHPKIRYLSREDDVGVEGLRKVKQSYYPDLMVEKHMAVMK